MPTRITTVLAATVAAAATFAAVAASTGTSYASPSAPAAAGAAGAAYTASGTWRSFTASGGTVAQVKLPAGKYVINAQIVLNKPTSSAQANFACLINGTGFYRGLAQLPAGAHEMITIPMTHAISLSAAKTVPVTCSASIPFQAGATVTAIQVASVSQQ